MLFLTVFKKPKNFCYKPRTLLSFLYLDFIQCAKLLSEHLEWNFNHLLGMELVTDVVFLVLSSANNGLIIYVFASGVGCEVRYAGTTGLKNIPSLSGRATCTINVSDKETSMLRLKIWMLSFLKQSKYKTLKRPLLR